MRLGLGIFLFTTVSRPALGPIQLPIQWVPGALSQRVKRPGLETDNSPPSSDEVKMRGAISSLPQYASMAWCLVKHRDNFTFYLFTFINVQILIRDTVIFTAQSPS
jgi:hypothetical protein